MIRSDSVRRRTLTVLALAALLVPARGLRASEELRKGVAGMAKDLKQLLDSRGENRVVVGAFTGPANLSTGAGPGIIRITSPEGRLLGTINLPIYGGEPKRQICATNVAFGGPDGRTLFMAGCDSVYTIQLKAAGIVPAHNVNK